VVVLEGEGQLEGLVYQQLLLTLLGLLFGKIEYLEPISSIHFHSITKSICLIEGFANASTVIEEQPSILDDLDAGFGAQVS
jgi:hypothetical protein